MRLKGRVTITDLLGGDSDIEQALRDLLVLNSRGEIRNLAVAWEESDHSLHCDAISESRMLAVGLVEWAKLDILTDNEP